LALPPHYGAAAVAVELMVVVVVVGRDSRIELRIS
jgi:hypothetical protein